MQMQMQTQMQMQKQMQTQLQLQLQPHLQNLQKQMQNGNRNGNRGYSPPLIKDIHLTLQISTLSKQQSIVEAALNKVLWDNSSGIYRQVDASPKQVLYRLGW